MIKWLLSKLFPKPRISLVFVTYGEAESLIKNGYTIAKEEDNNHKLGWVYLELLEGANTKFIDE
jgi:hypothetical protein